MKKNKQIKKLRENLLILLEEKRKQRDELEFEIQTLANTRDKLRKLINKENGKI